jgi:hypothetical protein
MICLATIAEDVLMNKSTTWPIAAFVLSLSAQSAAFAAADEPPKIETMEWEEAETVCEAWPEGAEAKDARATGLSWVSYPASVKPFGMRSYMKIDGVVHPLKQIAYAKPDGTISVYYRTPGYRHYDVYLTLNGLEPGKLTGSNLTGTLVVARFGLYREIKIAGACGMNVN